MSDATGDGRFGRILVRSGWLQTSGRLIVTEEVKPSPRSVRSEATPAEMRACGNKGRLGGEKAENSRKPSARGGPWSGMAGRSSDLAGVEKQGLELAATFFSTTCLIVWIRCCVGTAAEKVLKSTNPTNDILSPSPRTFATMLATWSGDPIDPESQGDTWRELAVLRMPNRKYSSLRLVAV